MASGLVTRKEPVHFRVTRVVPNIYPPPLDQLSRPDQLRLEIDYLNYPGAPDHLPIRPAALAPYRAAVEEAIHSQATYWVDWSEHPHAAFQEHPTLTERLLRAIRAGQTVPVP